MPERYRNPPIIEAVCQYRFDPTSSWDLTAPGLIYERLRDQFPKRQPRANLQARTERHETDIAHNVLLVEGIRFTAEDDRAFVELSPHRISVHHVKPYVSWEVFRPLIMAARDAYLDILRPSKIFRIGLRYINEIILPGEDIELKDYFTFYPHIGKELPPNYFAFQCSVDFSVNPNDALRLRITSAGDERQVGTKLDLDYFLVQPEAVSLTDDDAWLESAHRSVDDAFEGAITDRTRTLFEPIVGG